MDAQRKAAVAEAAQAVRPQTKKRRPAAETIDITLESQSESQAESLLPEDVVSKLILDHRENGRKLARSILRRWRVRMPPEEVDSIVDLSLCEAARRYSAEHGASFMTFFFYHLRGHLVRSVARAAQGSNVFLAFARSAGIENPEWSEDTVEAAWAYMPEYIVHSQREHDTPEHAMIRQEKIAQCQTACAQLDTLEREIIDRSFSSEQPLVDIAKSLGYSRCHISRVKKSALDRLKNILSNTESSEPASKPERQEVREELPRPARITSLDRARTIRRARRRHVQRLRSRIGAESKVA